MTSLLSDSSSSTPASSPFYQSPSSSNLFLSKLQQYEHQLETEKSDQLEDSFELDILHTANLDKQALIGEKKHKKETKKIFQLGGIKKDKSNEGFESGEFAFKDSLLFPLLPKINSSFKKRDIEEKAKQPHSSVYYDALEEPVEKASAADGLPHNPVSLSQGFEQQGRQPKTNSSAALNSSSAAEQATTCGVPHVPHPTSSGLASAAHPTSMVRRLTGGGRKRQQQQHVLATNQHQSSSSSSTGGSLHLVTQSRNPRHQPVHARHNQMYLITTLLPNGQPDQQALINRVLPKELILRVFSYLDIVSLCRCAQVCRSWNKLAMDGSNWQSVDLFDFQKDVKTAVVESLARRCGGFLKVLSLKGCENVQDSAMRSFAAKCHNIEKLSLNKCKLITDATCEFIGRYCHRLKELDLENCTAITDLTMKFISEGCKRLEELNISWCENITDRGIAYICRGSPNLHTLICKGCEGLSPSCFAQVNNDLKQLRKLSLLSCSNVTDETVEQLANGCNQLEFLCLSNCKEITDQALSAIAQGCPNIKDLELASCTNLTDTGFITLSKNCHELERMDLEDCSLITDAALLNLNNGCPNLSSLALSHCENLTDTGLAELCATHRDCLTVLELDNCPNITDAALDSMKTLKQLERVDLFDCQMITKDAIKKFKQFRPEVDVHAYFAPATPPVVPQPQRNGICKCCAIL